MNQQHIDDDVLSSFVKATLRSAESNGRGMESVQYHDVLDHLALCAHCRVQVDILTTLHNDLSSIKQQSQLNEAQQQQICDYLDGHLSAQQSDDVRSLILSQHEAMRAALHYQSHAEVMRKDLVETVVSSAESRAVENKKPPVFLTARFLSTLKLAVNFQTPLLFTMTATAAIFMVVIVLLQSPGIGQKQTVIASYQDDPTVQFSDQNVLPGIGFFSQSSNTSKPFNDIRIEIVAEDMIKISWPELDGVSLYKMRIQVFNHGKKTVLKETSSRSSHMTFQLESEAEQDNKHYEWILYGNTMDDRRFYASGGFVIDKGY